MAREEIIVGQYPNDGTGDNIRTAYAKINRMTEELYGLASGVNRFRGAHDLSTEEYPSTGGNGTDGIPAIGDEWYGVEFGMFTVEGVLGVIELRRGAMFTYIGNGDDEDPAPWEDPASWIVKQ
jgi:hypothetical protein